MRIAICAALALAVVLCSGCKEEKPVINDCGTCLGDACPVPGKDGDKAEGRLALRRVPLLNLGAKQEATAPEVSALTGEQGHYNDVKLSGMAHKDVAAEQGFFVRGFNRGIWPGGVPLEAEIDPAIMNF